MLNDMVMQTVIFIIAKIILQSIQQWPIPLGNSGGFVHFCNPVVRALVYPKAFDDLLCFDYCFCFFNKKLIIWRCTAVHVWCESNLFLSLKFEC